MITNLSKRLAYVCLLSVQLLTYSTAYAKSGGAIAGGGGDATEERVNEIRADLLKWINRGDAKDLTLPPTISYGEYESKMQNILKQQEVIIGFVEKDDPENEELQVSVNGMPKTCRGFISKEDSRYHILCNIQRFQNTKDAEQYKLIHHEYAGLVNVENNDEAASDYSISSQITEYLSMQTVLRLAVKTKRDEAAKTPEFKLTKKKYMGNQKYEVEFTLMNSENVLQVTLSNKGTSGCREEFNPKTVLKGEKISYKVIVDTADRFSHICQKVEFNNVVVQYTDGSVEVLQPLEYEVPRDLYRSGVLIGDVFIENVVKEKFISEEAVKVVQFDAKLTNYKMNYDISFDTNAVDLSQYRGVVIRRAAERIFGEDVGDLAVEFMSDDPTEIEKFLKSQKVNLKFTYEQDTKNVSFGCSDYFDIPCLYSSRKALKTYSVYGVAEVTVKFITKGDITGYRIAKTNLPKVH